ncbi:MAG TPA: hypothetical protein VK859_12640, partial [bacterium]|nr:hypothetical protein [bacterium]
VSMDLAHLAFWDLRQAFLLKGWLEKGVKPSSIPNMVDVDAINGSLSVLSARLPAPEAAKLVTEAAEAIDLEVEKLTPEQAEELVKMGFERLLHRALHRRAHLDKIEKALNKTPL